MEYLWYSVLTEEQFTTYSQQDGYMPLLRYGGLADATHKQVEHTCSFGGSLQNLTKRATQVVHERTGDSQ
eukprot:797020-Amphidinium_carterae.1